MLSKKTVVILGAGASQPYGFPVGSGLTRLLHDELTFGGPVHTYLSAAGYHPDAIADFRDAFLGSGKESVDAFLEHRSDKLQIGKAAIAAALLRFENPERVSGIVDRGWLRTLYAKLNASFDDFQKSPISFVTFNYDRSVEFFLHRALMQSYGKTSDEAWQALSGIPIVHLHGRLGYLPGEAGAEDANTREFAPKIDAVSLKMSAEGIKIIHEKMDETKDRDFLTAKKLINEAEHIIIMGFGYDTKNMERLGVADFKVTAIGSRMDFSNKDKALLDQRVNGKISFAENNDCLDMVRERFEWSLRPA